MVAEAAQPTIIQSWMPRAMSEATKAMAPTATLTSPAGWAAFCGATVMAAPVETDLDAEAAAGFFSCTVAWGMPGLGPAELAGTRAVSFLLSDTNGAGAMVGAPGATGGFGVVAGFTEAAGMAGAGGFGAAGAAGGVEGGVGGLIPPTEGGLGGATGAAPGTDGGLGGATGAVPGTEGGLGIDGATAEAGWGAAGAGTAGAGGVGGLTLTGGGTGAAEGGTAGAGAGGTVPAAFCTGFGGRLIIAVSRGLDAKG